MLTLSSEWPVWRAKRMLSDQCFVFFSLSILLFQSLFSCCTYRISGEPNPVDAPGAPAGEIPEKKKREYKEMDHSTEVCKSSINHITFADYSM
jgi:hypothetical protein